MSTPPSEPAAAAASHPPLPIVYQDEDVVAVSKPSGLLVHRDEHHRDAPAALQVVRDQTQRHLYPFHRLDRATSGILLFAFSSAAAAAWQEALAAAEAHKRYVALVRWPGSVPGLGDRWTCEQPLHDDKDVARAAHSEFALVERFRHCAVVDCRIHTGRYHQIRRHANLSGRHVIGDTTHGKGRINALYRERYGLHRLFLHLATVQLRHPRTGAALVLADPLPAELLSVLEGLRREAVTRPDAAPETA
ncbi:MAG: pseudouridylate synthase [Planctomycetes bacterium]|nr:pseudouridylate synthase [Planctomycetota bacterium]